jgi:hypothetical protein
MLLVHGLKGELGIMKGTRLLKKNYNLIECHICQCHGVHSFECHPWLVMNLYLNLNLISVHS